MAGQDVRVGSVASVEQRTGPRFDRRIADGGYFWHYVDAMSDDGAVAIVVIALLGSPFSPAYARARARGPASALRYSSMNVALYDRRRGAWSLAERSVDEASRSGDGLSIGASTMHWQGGRLVVEIDERETPLGQRLRGRVVVHPEARTNAEYSIDDVGEHRWWPIAPLARVEADFASHSLRFSGHGYHDANAGDAPIESAFEQWSWSRARSEDGALITYDVECASRAERSIALRVSPEGEVSALSGLAIAPIATTLWGIPRAVRVDAVAIEAGRSPRLVRTLENGPFYSRSLVRTELGGRNVLALHESLAGHRLRSGLVRLLTRFRMRTFR